MLKSILCVILAASALFGQSVFPPASGGGGGSGCVPAGSVGQLLIDSGAGACSSSGDFTISTHTLAGGASAVLDLHLMATSAFKLPGGFATGLVHVTTTTGAMAGGLLVNADIGAASIDPAKLVGGTFGAGNYVFPANVTVGTSLSVDGTTGIATTSKIGNAALSLLTGAGKWSSGVPVGQAACADLSNAGTGCSATIGNYLPLAGGTMVGSLLFTDATYDIGASGATRPRDVFLSRDLTVGRALITNAEFDNGTCSTSKTITPANGNRQKVTLTNAQTCALTFTQPGSGTVSIQLKIIQSAAGSFNGLISGGLWPGGVVPTITATTGAIDIATCYLNGTSTYCAATQDLR